MTKIVKLSDRQGPDAATVSAYASPELVAARLTISHYMDLAKQRPDMGSVVMNITPVIAEAMLELNKVNRPKRSKAIASKIDIINTGKWVFNGATIVFGDHGYLVDGQHRLEACRKSGITIKSHVVFGIDRNAFIHIDNGKTRTHSDTFRVMNVKKHVEVSAAIRVILKITQGTIVSRVTVSNSDIAEAYRFQYDDIHDSIRVCEKVYRVLRQPKGAVAGIHYLFSKISQRKADDFFMMWAEGRYTSIRGCPIRSLNERLNILKSQSHGRVHDTVRMALIIKACNAFFSDRSLTLDNCQWSLTDEFPKIGG